MYKLSLAANSSTSSFNFKSSALKRPPPPERAVSDSAAATMASVRDHSESPSPSSSKNLRKAFSSPFKRAASPAASPAASRPAPSAAAAASSSAAAGGHTHSNSVPLLSTTTNDLHDDNNNGPIMASSNRSPGLLDPRASALVVRQRTTSSPSFHQGALHMARLANGNIRNLAAKARQHFTDFSVTNNNNNPNRSPSPLARFSKGFPSRSRSASQPLSSLAGGDHDNDSHTSTTSRPHAAAAGHNTDASRSSSQSSSSAAASPSDVALFGLKLPRRASLRHQVFGVPLQDAVKATRLISPDRLPQEHLLVSATRSSVDLTDSARQRIEAKAYLPAVCLRALEYIEAHVDEEGLYRVSGSHVQVQQLKTLFDAGLQLDLRTLSTSELDPHSVTGVFKLWLRSLPQSLLTPDVEVMLDGLLQQELGVAATTKNGLAYTPKMSEPSPRSAHWTVSNPPPDLIDKMAIVLATLSLDRWHLLRELAAHLALLDSHAHRNKMTLANLRLILSPTLHLSPAMLQILVEQRQHLFDRDRAHQLATPTTSPTALLPPTTPHHHPRLQQDGETEEQAHSAPPALFKTFASQQADAGAPADASLRAEWKAEDWPGQRLVSSPGTAAAAAPRPAAAADKSDEASTTRGSRTSVSTLEFSARRRSRSLSALGDHALQRKSSAADLTPAAPTTTATFAAATPSIDVEDSEAEDLVSSASSLSDHAKSILTVDTSGDEGQRMKRSASSMSHTLSDEDGAASGSGSGAEEVLVHGQKTQSQDAAKTRGSRAASPAPSLSLSFDPFGSGLLDADHQFSWSEKR